MVITELGKFDITPDGVHVAEIAPGVTLDEIKSKTQAKIID